MKTLLTILFASLINHVGAQYYLAQTRLTCESDRKDEVMKGHLAITNALSDLVKDGRLLNFDFSQEKEGEKLILTYMFPVLDEATFKKIGEAWREKSMRSDAILFESFWKYCPNRKDSITSDKPVLYPHIKRYPWTLVAVVDGIDEKPDPLLNYNIVMDFTAFSSVAGKKEVMDSAVVNWGLADIGRIYNLHVAAGIPKENIHIVVAVHGGPPVRTFFTNETYQKKYKRDNPNLPLIEELTNAGVKFLVCGQSLAWLNFKKEMLSPLAKVTLTAQTTLSSYQMKGYALKSLGNE